VGKGKPEDEETRRVPGASSSCAWSWNRPSGGFRRPSPAFALACLALLAALGGTVYAAERISGRAIAVRSLPGNRLVPGSLPANRLRPGSIPGNRLGSRSITGVQIDVATLGQVPSSVHADNANSAGDAERALNAVNAVNAETVNGHSAGCRPGTRPFAGACWQVAFNEAAVSATAAATSCATQGGELPNALALATFSQQPGIELAAGSEWTSDIFSFTDVNEFSLAAIKTNGDITSAGSTATRKYRCVIPLVS
jgi:hypothetical protein